MRPNSLQLKKFKRYARQKKISVKAQRAMRVFERERLYSVRNYTNSHLLA